MRIQQAKLDFWAKNNLNVLFRGPHGIGKTALMTSTFKRLGYRFKYFSAATMDPWVDFLGVPKEKQDPITGQTYLDLIRPKDFSNDEIDALIFDEFNRSHAKVRNAVMELLQFKSINGKKFENLKVIWAAINPDDEDSNYDVEALDPAQLDRFQIHVDMPYSPDAIYFKEKYDERGSIAISWWNDLSSDVQGEISPRRLDQAIDVFLLGGDMRDVLTKKANVNQLIVQLNSGSFKIKLEKLFSSKDRKKAIEELNNENFCNAVIDDIVKNQEYLKYFHDLIPEEKLSNIIVSSKKTRKRLLSEISQSEALKNVSQNIVSANGVKSAVTKDINSWMKKNYSTSQPVIALEFNTAINSLFHSGKVGNINEKINMIRQLTNNLETWAGKSNILNNVMRFICEVIIRTQEGAITYKNIEDPLCRLIYFCGEGNFANYCSTQRKTHYSKFSGRADKLTEFMKKNYTNYIASTKHLPDDIELCKKLYNNITVPTPLSTRKGRKSKKVPVTITSNIPTIPIHIYETKVNDALQLDDEKITNWDDDF